MTDDNYYDEEWIPQEAKELEQAAQYLEEFRSDADIAPRKAFLVARWLRSHAAEITRRARAERQVQGVDENALTLARELNAEKGEADSA